MRERYKREKKTLSKRDGSSTGCGAFGFDEWKCSGESGGNIVGRSCFDRRGNRTGIIRDDFRRNTGRSAGRGDTGRRNL